jgi:hypothetical protein
MAMLIVPGVKSVQQSCHLKFLSMWVTPCNTMLFDKWMLIMPCTQQHNLDDCNLTTLVLAISVCNLCICVPCQVKFPPQSDPHKHEIMRRPSPQVRPVPVKIWNNVYEIQNWTVDLAWNNFVKQDIYVFPSSIPTGFRGTHSLLFSVYPGHLSLGEDGQSMKLAIHPI